MISLANVTKGFNLGKENEFKAVSGVSLSIEAGKITVLKGPSGSGKTTLLSLIGCMVRPTSGRVTVEGIGRFTSGLPADDGRAVEVTSLPERFLAGIRLSVFGFVFQQFNLIKGITVLENVMLPSYPLGKNHGKARKRALGLLERFGLKRHARSPVEYLSGGEAQRVAIARALMNDPLVIIADEPTAHLDSALSEEFMESMRRLKADGKTVVIASHDPLVYDGAGVDRVITIRDGRIHAEKE